MENTNSARIKAVPLAQIMDELNLKPDSVDVLEVVAQRTIDIINATKAHAKDPELFDVQALRDCIAEAVFETARETIKSIICDSRLSAVMDTVLHMTTEDPHSHEAVAIDTSVAEELALKRTDIGCQAMGWYSDHLSPDEVLTEDEMETWDPATGESAP